METIILDYIVTSKDMCILHLRQKKKHAILPLQSRLVPETNKKKYINFKLKLFYNK